MKLPFTLVVMLLVCLVLPGCSRDPDEAALRERIGEMVAAVEEREPRRFMEGVAEDFDGEHSLDRSRLQGMLRAQLLRNQHIGITVLSTEMLMHGERATVTQQVVLTGGGSNFIPDQYRRLRVESGWRIEEGSWVVYSARWEGN